YEKQSRMSPEKQTAIPSAAISPEDPGTVRKNEQSTRDPLAAFFQTAANERPIPIDRGGDGADPLSVELGKRIRQARIAKGLSLQRVGSSLGVTHQQVHKYESASNRVSVVTLIRIAELLNVDVAALIADLGSTPTPQSDDASIVAQDLK